MNSNIKDIYNLTPSQEGIYAQYFQSNNTKTYQLQNLIKIDKNTDLEILRKSVELLSLRHQILKSAFTVLKSGAIKQVILENRTPEIIVVSYNEPFSQDKLDKLINEDSERTLDLQKDSLLRVTIVDFADERYVIMHTHHIIVDGWCLPILITDLQKYYGKLSEGTTVEALMKEINEENRVQTSYAEYVNWIRKQDVEKVSEYWETLLAEGEPSHIYGKEKKESTKSENVVTFRRQIGEDESRRIETFARENRLTANSVFECAFGIALQKYSGSEDIVFDKVISGRSIPLKNIDKTVGLFINTVPVRTTSDDNTTLADLLKETQRQTINANANGILPLSEIYKASGIDSKSVDAFFVFENYYTGDMSDIEKGPLSPKSIFFKEQTEFNLTLTISKEENCYTIKVSYAKEMYTEEEISSFLNGYVSILQSSLDAEKKIKDITVLSDVEKEKLLNDFNNTDHEYDVPDNSTLYSLFEVQAEKNKEKVCLKVDGKEITFGDFKAYAERIDSKIRKITKEEKSVIAVICERSFEMYGAVYGIIRGGNAYLPIDPNYPQERIDYILSNSNAKAVITQDKFCHLAGNTPCINATEVLDNKENAEKTEILATENDTAYVIYTSGSTGNPKGAKISHKSAVNRILWMDDFYPMEEKDVILQKTPYTFDVSVWELFWWGIKGRTLCASKPDEHFLPAKILEETHNHKVTHLHFVPSVFDIFLTYLENNPDEQYKFNSVKYVFLSGEALTANSINRFYNIYDYNKVSLHNLYGPTECAVDVSYYDCKPEDIDPVPIGKPIYNTQLYVVDKHLNPTPIGVTGELCIGGVNVGQGYLNNEELTKEKFIDNPFGDGKIYKTGDLAYWREDGQIIYCGRMDNQIKLNGQRIELGEIEKVIGEIPDIDSVAVLVKKNNGQDVLIAFCCGNENAIFKVTAYCENKLPHYMVPAKFQFIEEMPLNQSGKLDRKALNNIDVVFDNVAIKEEPVTETEKEICELFQKTLGIDFVGKNENFFALGGTSLDMIAILSENTMQNISAADFISNPTPEKLANILDMFSIQIETEYIKPLYKTKSDKALVLFPFAGGGAEAFVNLVESIKTQNRDISIYFVKYLHTFEECKNTADEISEILKNKEIYFYSHCVGSAVAMQILNILEDNNIPIKHYIAGASIPAEKPAKRNIWNITPDFILRNILVKAGAPFDKLSKQEVHTLLKKFRKDTTFATKYFSSVDSKINCPVSTIFSKNDMFTKTYNNAEKLWSKRSNNIESIYFIEATSHYFQSDNSDTLAEIILKIIE